LERLFWVGFSSFLGGFTTKTWPLKGSDSDCNFGSNFMNTLGFQYWTFCSTGSIFFDSNGLSSQQKRSIITM